MNRVLALLACLAVGGTLALGQTIRLLIVDETKTLEESLRIAAFARAVRGTGFFSIKALPALPTHAWEDEPFLFAIIVPETGRFIWLCTPAPIQYLPEPLPEAYAGLAQGLREAFAGEREVRGSGDDLYVLLLAIQLQRLGILVGVGGP